MICIIMYSTTRLTHLAKHTSRAESPTLTLTTHANAMRRLELAKALKRAERRWPGAYDEHVDACARRLHRAR